MHWIKNFNFLKKNYYVYYIILAVGCVFSASCSNYAFHISIFSAQQTFTMSYFRRTILGLVGKISSCLKINKRGAAIRMSWCAFFEKINSRGTFIPDWRIVEYSFSLRCHILENV